jgi:hypothetical protein
VLATFLNAHYVITKRYFGMPCHILVFIYLSKMLRGSWSLMLSVNFCIGIIAVMQFSVSAHRVVPMEWLEHGGNLCCVGTVEHRAFMWDVVG